MFLIAAWIEGCIACRPVWQAVKRRSALWWRPGRHIGAQLDGGNRPCDGEAAVRWRLPEPRVRPSVLARRGPDGADAGAARPQLSDEDTVDTDSRSAALRPADVREHFDADDRCRRIHPRPDRPACRTAAIRHGRRVPQEQSRPGRQLTRHSPVLYCTHRTLFTFHPDAVFAYLTFHACGFVLLGLMMICNDFLVVNVNCP